MYKVGSYACSPPREGGDGGIFVTHIRQCGLANPDLQESCLNEDFNKGGNSASTLQEFQLQVFDAH